MCIVALGIQAFIVNHYLISFYSSAWYAWYIADAFSLFVFIFTFIDAFRHLKNKRKGIKTTKDLFKGKLGYLPMVYISWLIYSVLIAIRIGIIFKYIAPSLEESMMYGPNMLKTGLSLSSIVFFFLVIAHVEAEPKSIIDQYVTGIIGRVTIDILDSVQFLELLFIHDTHIFLTFNMHNAIVAIGCVNLILPTFKLAILSGWHFGEKRMDKLLETFSLLFYLLVINVPLLVIRILLWSVHSSDVSVFIIKNILSLCMSIKAIHDHFVDLGKDETDASNQQENADENVQLENMSNVVHPEAEIAQEAVVEEEKRHLNDQQERHKFV